MPILFELVRLLRNGEDSKMRRELADEIFDLIESRSESRPTAMEFEMAYQARVAVERIRFAIKHTEQFCPNSDPLREAGLQLLDALQRLENVDGRFQKRSRTDRGTCAENISGQQPVNGNRSSSRDVRTKSP